MDLKWSWSVIVNPSSRLVLLARRQKTITSLAAKLHRKKVGISRRLHFMIYRNSPRNEGNQCNSWWCTQTPLWKTIQQTVHLHVCYPSSRSEVKSSWFIKLVSNQKQISSDVSLPKTFGKNNVVLLPRFGHPWNIRDLERKLFHTSKYTCCFSVVIV